MAKNLFTKLGLTLAMLGLIECTSPSIAKVPYVIGIQKGNDTCLIAYSNGSFLAKRGKKEEYFIPSRTEYDRIQGAAGLRSGLTKLTVELNNGGGCLKIAGQLPGPVGEYDFCFFDELEIADTSKDRKIASQEADTNLEKLINEKCGGMISIEIQNNYEETIRNAI